MYSNTTAAADDLYILDYLLKFKDIYCLLQLGDRDNGVKEERAEICQGKCNKP